MIYDFELDRAICEIASSGAKRVGLQFPEGLKQDALEIGKSIEDATGVDVFLLCDPTYGGCDLHERSLSDLGLDILLHFGHTPFKKPD